MPSATRKNAAQQTVCLVAALHAAGAGDDGSTVSPSCTWMRITRSFNPVDTSGSRDTTPAARSKVACRVFQVTARRRYAGTLLAPPTLLYSHTDFLYSHTDPLYPYTDLLYFDTDPNARHKVLRGMIAGLIA